MNYWPSLVTNLGDLTGPLWSVINSMKRTGANTARLMYNQSGIVGHHNTDLWGDTAPQDNYVSATFWPNGLLWLAAWIYEQYQYDGNMTFLQDNYETLQELFTFYDGFLTEWNGYRVTNPSLSPENEYFLPNTSIQEAITLGPTIDNSLLWELCGNLLDGMEALGMNNRSFQSGVMSMRQSLPPLKISYFGGIQEWIEDYLEVSCHIAQPDLFRKVRRFVTNLRTDSARHATFFSLVCAVPWCADHFCQCHSVECSQKDI